MINALQKEIMLSSHEGINDNVVPESIETIYFGGGTPSLLSENDIKKILEQIKKNYTVNDNAEITLEANPDDINKEKLSSWKNAGINRLSVGIQSFKEADLLWMNRAHNATQAYSCIQLVKDAGFTNFSCDLIYGIPNLSDDEWKTNFETLARLDVPHIACYALTIEKETALDKMILLKKKENVSADDQARQFLLLMKWMKEAGYEHYEISNFAKEGCRSKHNSSYWKGKKYIGIGPSAHSYNGISRRWNIANNVLYIQSINNGIVSYEEEILSDSQKLNEYIMTSLRTLEGLNLDKIEKDFSLQKRKKIESAALRYLHKCLMENITGNLVLTDEGKLFADGIASDLFIL